MAQLRDLNALTEPLLTNFQRYIKIINLTINSRVTKKTNFGQLNTPTKMFALPTKNKTVTFTYKYLFFRYDCINLMVFNIDSKLHHDGNEIEVYYMVYYFGFTIDWSLLGRRPLLYLSKYAFILVLL